MSLFYSFNAYSRNKTGRVHNNFLRENDKIPCIIYGLNFLEKVYVFKKDIDIILDKYKNGNVLFNCTFNDNNFLVLVKEIQKHSYKNSVLHMDFNRVSDLDYVKANVLLKFVGVKDSIGLKNGGVLIKYMSSVLLKCKVSDIPSFIEVDISNINTNQSVFLYDLLKNKSNFLFLNKANTLIASISGSRSTEAVKN